MEISDGFSVASFEFDLYNSKVCMYLYSHSECISNEIRRLHNFFEYPLLNYIRNNFRKGCTIVDVGANIGNHTLFFAKFCTYQRIFAFEPHPINNKILHLNVGRIANVAIFDVALGESFGSGTMSNIINNMGSVYVESGHGDILIKPLDYYDIHNIDLLKIDVERTELSVLRGSINTIQREHPRIFVEVDRDEYKSADVDSFLKGMGYEYINTWLDEGSDSLKTQEYAFCNTLI